MSSTCSFVSSSATKHPLDPLTSDEISAISKHLLHHMMRNYNQEKVALKFVSSALLPPPKRVVLAHLGIPLEASSKSEPPMIIMRRAEVELIDALRGYAYHAELSLVEDIWVLDKLNQLPAGVHPQMTLDELLAGEEAIRNNPIVQKLARDVGVEPDQIRCDGWCIGFDDRFPQAKRIQQAFLFARLYDYDNLYAHPLDFVPVIDANTKVLLHVDFPPHYNKTANGHVLPVSTTAAPPTIGSIDKALADAKRDRIPPPLKPFDFLPDLMKTTEEGGFRPRRGLKPLHISQPEGVSFKLDGHVLEWQGWKMHVAFGQREGLAISTITFDDRGEIRPIFYRLSLGEMVVPYGAPEHPHPRKFAFDSGEYGIGMMANELSLGCDCVGHIQYLPGIFIGNSGNPIIFRNVICIHEEDAGILWKRTDYHIGGRSQTVRRRRLVVSMACTLANYEYILNYLFYQDGSIEFEIRLSGIVQVYVAKDGEPNPHGTTVAPGVNAQYHQHLLSLRIDPMIDGLNNSLVETDVMPLPDAPTGSAANHAGNAFIARDTVITAASGRDWNYSTDRKWKIVNPSKTHYSSGKNKGYTIVTKSGATPFMLRPDSWVAKRATFATKSLWVCRDVEGEGKGTERMWPAGKYVPQTWDSPEDSVGNWVKSGEKVDDEDILVFVTIGTTHIPRPEDWPVMPVEHVNVFFKPNSFFDKNPSMDVPGTNDLKSVLVNGDAERCHSCV